jgi:DNA polymerase I
MPGSSKGLTKTQQSLFNDEVPEHNLSDRPNNAASIGDLKDPERPVGQFSLQGKTVWVIDSHSLIYQVFFAMGDMSSPDGRPVNAIFGFIRDVLDIIDNRNPDLVFCAFDISEITFRNEIFDQYKAHRDPMPEDLRSQIPHIRRMLTALSIPILELQGFEADDIMATIARKVTEQGGKTVLVTTDKDCRQLLSTNVSLFNIRKNKSYGPEDLLKDWGIAPEQVVDFQALVGDSVDNVPGVPLIGPKFAKELLTAYGTLESVLDNAEQVSGKKRKENLRTYRDQAMLSRQLVELNANVPIEITWSEGIMGGANVDQAVEICKEFGFRTLTERIGGLQTKFTQTLEFEHYQTIDDPIKLERLVTNLLKCNAISFDTETTSPMPRWAELVGISLSWETGHAAYIPIRAPRGQTVIPQDVACDILRPLLENESISKIGQNLKYDIVVMRGCGVEIRGPLFDTMVADYLLDPGQRNHSIDDLAKRYLNHQTIKISELIGSGRNQKRMDEVPVELVTTYAAEDADIPFRLYPLLKEQLQKQGLEQLFNEIEMPLIKVLANIEFRGIKVDTQVLKKLSTEFAGRIETLRTEIIDLAGEDFNIDSPSQLGRILFEKLNLPVVKKTKTGFSTDVEVLNELAANHELPRRIIEYRQYSKLKSTYTDALAKLVNPITNRVHTSLMQDVAATGRLSSKDPNLQNIPIRTETGRKIRTAFVAGFDDYKILKADYSQIELRMLAHFCKDQILQKAFLANADIHSAVAAEVHRVDLDHVTSEMRRGAKAINFGIIYGQSSFGLAKSLGISKDEAATFIEAYFEKYPQVDQFMHQTLEIACRNGYVITILGRRRAVQGVRDPNERPGSRQRTLPERIAINTVIQGSAADLIKLAMIRVDQALNESGLRANLLLQIHDELLFEVHESDIESLAELVIREMSHAFELDVPLVVDVEVGDNWGQTETWKPH